MKASVAKIFIYPFKGLDPQEVKEVKILESGALEHDREFVLFNEEGKVISGKREKRIHKIRSFVDFKEERMTFVYEGRSYDFAFSERRAVEEFFSEIFCYKVFLKRFKEGLPDDREAHGPTVVSQETLREIAGWFDLDLENVRRRFRANIEVEGVPAFWEDMLVQDKGYRAFKIGEVSLLGAGISKRCPVPTRDPYSGVETRNFVKRFIQKRKETLPSWSPRERFKDTFYRLCVNTVVKSSEAGKVIRVGDEILL